MRGMKMIIKILHYPKEYINIIYLAGRNCYGLTCIHKDTSEQTKKSFVNKIVNNQHFSVLEHINITIFIKNASRASLLNLQDIDLLLILLSLNILFYIRILSINY